MRVVGDGVSHYTTKALGCFVGTLPNLFTPHKKASIFYHSPRLPDTADMGWKPVLFFLATTLPFGANAVDRFEVSLRVFEHRLYTKIDSVNEHI